MMICTLPSALLSDYLSDRAQCLVNVLALENKRKPESCQIGQEPTSYVQALRSVSEHIMRNSKVVASAFGALSVSALHSSSMAEKMKQLLESVSSIDAIQPWTVVLGMGDLLGATISTLLTQPVAERIPLATAQVPTWKTLLEGEQSKELPEAMNPAEMKQLAEMFASMMQYELSFLESALADNGQAVPDFAKLKSSPWHPSNIIFTTDYDVTCTIVDSCYFLLQGNEAFRPVMVRYEELQREVYSSLESQEKEDDGPAYWRTREQNENQYLWGFDPSLQPLLNTFSSDDIPNPDEEICSQYNDAGLRRALAKLANLEEVCNSGIMSVGFLKGATREEIRASARKVPLRPKCAEVLQQLARVGTDVHIVSANWSRDVILGGLPELPKDKLLIHCNELHFDSAGVTDGTFDNTCVDAFDKEKMLQLLRRLPSPTTVRTDESGYDPAQKMLVFLGDSPTDLLGLLEADLGIVFGESPRLRRLLDLYNIQLVPLAAATAHITVARSYGSNWSCRRSGILFEAQGWTDVEACLFGQIGSSKAKSAFSLSSKIEKLMKEEVLSQQQLDYEDQARDLLTPVSLELIRVSS